MMNTNEERTVNGHDKGKHDMQRKSCRRQTQLLPAASYVSLNVFTATSCACVFALRLLPALGAGTIKLPIGR